MAVAAREHPFHKRPHRTLLALSYPILLAMIAEPLTGLADTAFVARLGVESVTALGIGSILLSSVFWIFNFLMIGTQTEVARHSGAGNDQAARAITSLALFWSAVLGVLITGIGLGCAKSAVTLMGATPDVQAQATLYLRIRLFAAPAILITVTSFGALRGCQDVKSPLILAIAVNAINILLDAIFIFGFGPIPALGIAGAAWATVISQWLGAAGILVAIRSRIGWSLSLHFAESGKLFAIGRDLFLRTGLLTLFLLLTTRTATRIGAEAGAAHQAIRQVWLLTALALDSFAFTAQTLAGYFIGAGSKETARRGRATAQRSFVRDRRSTLGDE